MGADAASKKLLGDKDYKVTVITSSNWAYANQAGGYISGTITINILSGVPQVTGKIRLNLHDVQHGNTNYVDITPSVSVEET